MTVGIDVAANPQGAVAAARQITRSFEEMRKAVAAVNGELARLDDSVRADVEAANAALTQVINSKLGRGIRNGIATSGQAGVAPLSIDPSRIAATPSAGERMIVQAAHVAGIPTGTPPPPPAIPQGAEDEGEEPPSGGGSGGGMMRTGAAVLRRAMGIALPLAGIGSLIGTVGHGVSGAQRTDIDIDTLYRALGDLRTTFDDATETVRRFGEQMALTDDEGAKLLTLYAKAAGANSLADASGGRLAVGLARGYGIDPSIAVGEFGAMRYRGVGGRGASGDRELAAMIGQTIAQSGMYSKSDEVLAALTRFTEQASSYFVRTPPTEEFARLYASMNATGQPGLMGRNAESLIGVMDANFRHGGGMGESSKVFLYKALGAGDPFKFRYQLEGGLFDKGEDGTTNYEKVQGYFDKSYAGVDRFQRYDALANLYGLDTRQAEALEDLKLGSQAGDFYKYLSHLGIDMSAMRGDAIKTLGQIWRGEDMDDVKRRLLPGATPDEVQQIFEATPETQQDVYGRIAGRQGRDPTKGSSMAQSIADLNNGITRLGDRLLEPLSQIRDVLSGALGWAAGSNAATQVVRIAEGWRPPWELTMKGDAHGVSAGWRESSDRGASGHWNGPPAGVSAADIRQALDGLTLTLLTASGPAQVKLSSDVPRPYGGGSLRQP